MRFRWPAKRWLRKCSTGRSSATRWRLRILALRARLEAIRGGSPMENAAIIQQTFTGECGPRRDIIVINAAAALVAAGVADNFMEGAELAARTLSSGAAQEKLADLKKFTNAPDG